jgi:PAS domain S-box-containing protein
MEGAITSWNKGSERLFLYTADEALGRHVALIYPEESHDMLRNDIIPTLQSRGSHGYEAILLRKSGEEFTALVSLSLLTDENGEHTGMIGYTLDITDAKNLEQEREQLITKLEDALTKVKTLSGLLPICSSCKKIRDDKGYWNQIETYISRHSKAAFSHSICPECIKKLYPNIGRHQDKQD